MMDTARWQSRPMARAAVYVKKQVWIRTTIRILNF